MSTAMIAGLIANGFNSKNITVVDRNISKLNNLEKTYNIIGSQDLINSIDNDCIIVLSVKPQQMQEVVMQIKDNIIKNNNLIITVAAGLVSSLYEKWINENIALARVMPNTPSSLQCGASGIFYNKNVIEEQKQAVDYIMKTMGIAVTVDSEDKIDAVAANSGSGPAYFLMFIEAMIKESINMGLTPEQSKELATQTALGAAKMAINSNENISTLRENITSKGGTTAEALRVFRENNLDNIISQAMKANVKRSQELSKILSK